MGTLIQLIGIASIALGLYGLIYLLRLKRRSTPRGKARSFWWQMNQAWAAATSGFWVTTTTPYDPREEELARLLNGDRAAARRLAKGAGSADRAIAQVLRDRR
jgi:hypothetical protein